jgi:thiamine-monophosphate kinase
MALRGIANACIDISDGLAGPIWDISCSKARLVLVCSGHNYRYQRKCCITSTDTGDWQMPLTAGDDYELCFTAPAEVQAQLPLVIVSGLSKPSRVCA